MKKIFLSFAFLLAVLVLASCETSPTDSNVFSGLVYDRIDQRYYTQDEVKTIRVAMDLRYPPFETVSDLNDPKGISVDVAIAFGLFVGRKVEIVNTGFGAIIPALEAGEVDIAIASMSITAARSEIVDFSDPYFYFKIIALVNQTFATVNNITETSTTEDLRAIANARYAGIAGQITADRDAIPIGANQTFTAFTELSTVVENIVSGDADIFLLSANPVIQAYNANQEETMVVFSSFLSSPIGMAVQKGNATLLELANDFIDTFTGPGGLYEFLVAKYDADILAILGKFGLDFYIDEN